MTLFSYINDNIDRIKFDVRIGIISCTIMKHYQIYSRYEYYRRLGNSVCNSVIYCCNDFQVEQRAIYYIIKRMESPVNENLS